jgi:hypothetical protein
MVKEPMTVRTQDGQVAFVIKAVFSERYQVVHFDVRFARSGEPQRRFFATLASIVAFPLEPPSSLGIALYYL